MSALAKILKGMGKSVRGSDRAPNEYTAALAGHGIVVDYAADETTLEDCDVVVYTDAVRADEPHMLCAAKLGKPIIPRGRLLAVLCSEFDCVIAVAGCHGKTTCVSMLTHIFYFAGKKFTAHIGGNDVDFGNSFSSGSHFFITEACEYNKNFTLLNPDIGVVLNTDEDHLECYGGREELLRAYRQFADNSKRCVCLADGADVDGQIKFAIGEGDYAAVDVRSDGGKYSFCILEYGRPLCRVRLNVYGRHNIFNALAAAAAARMAGIRPDCVRGGLENFRGVLRRFEDIGKIGGCRVIADYAHHPREISATLRTAAEITSGKIYVIFQPHTYSRTKNLFSDFVGALSGVERLLIYKTFAAREYFDAEGSALTLARAIKKSRYGECERDILFFLRDVKRDDLVLVLGAGDIYSVVKNLLN